MYSNQFEYLSAESEIDRLAQIGPDELAEKYFPTSEDLVSIFGGQSE